MLIHRLCGAVRVWTPAKINLFLEVLGRRADGYHELATLMVSVGLFDTVEVRENACGDIRLACDHPNLSTGPDNLVCRAVELVRDRFHVRTGVDVRLHKRIPLQAGLAGGSSDAAATLAGLNCLWRLGLDANELGRLGAELGSDVSFFFFGPAAWCTGRGEIVQPLRPGRPLDLVLACPPVGLSTAAVFHQMRLPAHVVDGEAVRLALEAGDVNAIGRSLHNRLQEPAEELQPAVARLRQRLVECESAGVLMSGSGSTVFAVCRDAADASRIARALHSRSAASPWEVGGQTRVCVVRSCD